MKCEASPEACAHVDLIRALMGFCREKEKTVTYSTHFSFVSTRKMTIIMCENITKIPNVPWAKSDRASPGIKLPSITHTSQIKTFLECVNMSLGIIP